MKVIIALIVVMIWGCGLKNPKKDNTEPGRDENPAKEMSKEEKKEFYTAPKYRGSGKKWGELWGVH